MWKNKAKMVAIGGNEISSPTNCVPYSNRTIIVHALNRRQSIATLGTGASQEGQGIEDWRLSNK